MIVLFSCHANRHVRNLIIHSIIPVPGCYYNDFFSLSCHCVYIYSHLLLYNLIGVLHYSYRNSHTKDSICSSTFFQSLYIQVGRVMDTSSGQKIVGGVLCVLSRLRLCKSLLLFQLVEIPESGSPLGCLDHTSCPSAGDMCCDVETPFGI